MFTARIQEAPYADPWLQPLSVRLRSLVAGKTRVAYYYEAPNNSTFRYRAYNMAQALTATADGIGAACFFQSDTASLADIAAQADLLVICRSGYNYAINQWVSHFRKLGKRVLFDIDDFVFDTDYVHLLITTLGLDPHHAQVWEDWFAMVSRMGQTLRLCDAAITTNAYLAQRIQDFAQCPTAVVPNFMNPEQLAISDQVFQAKCANGFERDGRIQLGYFSGSPSHLRDFQIVEDAVAALMQSDERIGLTLVGYIEPGPALAKFGNRVSRKPFHDYVNLQRLVGEVEFNLMPLQSNVFTHCKSELKYFEAAAVGTLSIASPARNYEACIQPGVNGYLSQAHAWHRNIRQAIAELEDYAHKAGNARAHALAKYCGPLQRPAILRALGLA